MTYIKWANCNKGWMIKEYREKNGCGIYEAQEVVRKMHFLEGVETAKTLEDLKAVLFDYVSYHR